MSKFTLTIFIITVLILVNLPYVFFTQYHAAGLSFLGRLPINSQDVYTYLSTIEQVKQGHFLTANLYSGVTPPSYSLIRPSYIVLGLLARYTLLPSLTIYLILRSFVIILFCLFFYRFAKQFLSHNQIGVAMLVTFFSSGFGWLIHQYLPVSSDLWIPESNTWLTLFEAPHFVLSQLLMLLTLSTLTRYLKTQNKCFIFLYSFYCLLLTFEHPFNLIPLLLIIFVYVYLATYSLWQTLVLSLIPAVGLLYQVITTLSNPILASWQQQNILISPPPLAYLCGFGLLVPLLLFAAHKHLPDKPNRYLLLYIWIVITAICLYLPVNFQRRFVEGIQLPLSILATLGLYAFVDYFKLNKVQSRLIIGLIIIIVALGSLTFYINNFRIILKDSSSDYYYHIHPSEVKAIRWLGAHSQDSDLILSNTYFGNLIPGLIARPVYIGHKIQTLDYDIRAKALESFYASPNPQQQQDFLTANHIAFLYFGRNDPGLAQFTPDNLNSLMLVYNEDGVKIYQVSRVAETH